MKNWRAVIGSVIVACMLAVGGLALTWLHTERPPYNHVLTSVERIDEDADALRVYHDKVRGATCYETYGWPSQLSCIPDVWLKDR